MDLGAAQVVGVLGEHALKGGPADGAGALGSERAEVFGDVLAIAGDQVMAEKK